MDYALIEDGVITNVMWLNPANSNEFPNAVPLSDIPARIGDTYDGEHFYRNGEIIKSMTELLEDATLALMILGVIENEQYSGESGEDEDGSSEGA
jgi:enterochelin esterase-like enzyme